MKNPKEEKCTCKEHDPYCCQIHGNCPTCVKKEELKQENCCTPLGQIKRYEDCYDCDRKPKQEKLTYTESAKKEERISNSIMMKRKQKTVEEDDLKIPSKFCIPHKHYISDDDKMCYETGYKDGIKLMQERMYSEIELEVAFFEGRENNLSFTEWFQQFKNKTK